ncbi:GspE/PulE family protein [Pseudomonadota bacterium]
MRTYTLKGEKDLKALLQVHKRMSDMRLGEVLLEERLINGQQLQTALDAQKEFRRTGARHLGQILVKSGLVTPDQLNIALAKKLAIPYVRIENFSVDSQLLSLIPADLATQHKVLPLATINNSLVVAMVNPLDQSALDALRFNAKMNIESVMASVEELDTALGKHYASNDEYTEYEEFDALEDLSMDIVDEPVEDPSEAVHNIEQEAQKKPIVRLLNAILVQAVNSGASDINIRPERDRVNVFYRIDGKMQFVRTLHKSLLPALVSRVKITGRMNIAERRLPQDGHARMTRQGKQVDLRISVMPTVNGESVVIRVLDKEGGFKPLDELGLRDYDLQLIKQLISRPNGIFLVTGPTGSGKSTTLYAILNEVKQGNPHILTIEDPVEYDMEGVEQIQVNPVIGYDFAKALRNFLRHDPDVMMVGEIRDEETAKIANKAALTGHLVFSTLHTNDAPSTITRFTDMGIEPYLLSTTLLGVVAQRLIRVNCKECTEEEPVDPVVRELLNVAEDEKFYRGTGCLKCHYSGYRGRVSVMEMLAVTPEISAQIANGDSSQEIAKMAREQGMRSLQENALEIARTGKTSIEEVYALYTE